MLRGERRHATVLMADVVNSTQLLEALGSEAWVEMMNRVFQIAGSEIYRYGGEIDQFRGDGLVAFFGTRTAREDDPERAILAGLRTQAAVRSYAADLARAGKVALQLRVGINTGEVIVTQVGDRAQHLEQTAMGEAVALAARMESSAQPGTVLVSANTEVLVADVFEWQALGEISVKGVSQPVPVFRPLRRVPRPTGVQSRRGRQSLGGLDSSLVGRRPEFSMLLAAVESVRGGEGGAVVVVGEAGIGKSRLMAEVRLRAERSAGTPLLWVEGRCLALSGSTPYLPWRAILERLLGLMADGVGAAARADLREEHAELLANRVQALCAVESSDGDLGPLDRAEWMTRSLACVLGLVGEGASALADPSRLEADRETLAAAVSGVIGAIARRHPLVLAFEDLHWADEASLLLLERVLPLTARVPLLVVGVSRPLSDALPGIEPTLRRLSEALGGSGAAGAVLELGALVPDEVSQLVTNLLASRAASSSSASPDHALRGANSEVEPRQVIAGPGVSESLPMDMILAASGGNPYFVEELVRSLLGEGRLALGDVSAVSPIGGGSAEVPDSLQGVLTARMDRLTPQARRCLQVAAVVGRLFSWELLFATVQRLGRGDAALAGDLAAQLAELETAQMVRPRGDEAEQGSRRQFIFKHQLMQEAAYDGLLEGERRDIHRATALALEDPLESAAVPPGLLAYHWDAAGEPLRAIPHYLEAGRLALRAHAHDTATAAYRRALDAIDLGVAGAAAKPELGHWRFEALRGLGQVAFTVGIVSEAEAPLSAALELGRELGLPLSDLIHLYHWLGEVMFWLERFDERIALGEEGLSLLDPDAKTLEVALMSQMVAIGYLTLGDPDGFRRYTSRTAAFIGDLDFVPELLPAYEHVVMLHMMDQRLDRAREVLAVLAHRGDAANDEAIAVAIRRQEADILAEEGDLHAAVAAYRESLDLLARLSDTKHRVWVLGDAFWAMARLGDVAGARELLEEMRRAAPGLNHYKGTDYLLQGDILLGLGSRDPDAALGPARTYLARARRAMRNAPAVSRAALIGRASRASYLLGQVHLARGDRARAAEAFTDAADLGIEIGRPVPLAAVASVLNGLAQAAGSEWVAATAAPTVLGLSWGLTPAEPAAVLGTDVEPPKVLPVVGDRLDGNWLWHDPLGHCSWEAGEQGNVVLRAANGRGLAGANSSAPRLLTPVHGDVVVQALVGPVAEGLPCIGGLVLWWSEARYARLTVGDAGPQSVGLYAAIGGVSSLRSAAALSRPPSDGGVWLRLELVGGEVTALVSYTGAHWLRLVPVAIAPAGPCWAGACAIGDIDRTVYHGAFPEGTGVRMRGVRLVAETVPAEP